MTALQRCLLEVPGVLCKEMDDDMIRKTLSVMENMTVLLLGVLYGDQDTESKGSGLLKIFESLNPGVFNWFCPRDHHSD